MRQFQNLIHWAFTGTVLLLLSLLGSPLAQPQTQLTQPAQAPKKQENETQPSRMDRPLRLLVTVDDQSFLQVKEGEQVREGDVITDNKRERDRLTKEQKSINLHIQNLKNRTVHNPFEPKKPIPSKPLPPAIF